MTADAPDLDRIAELSRSPIAAAAVPTMIGYRMTPIPGVHRGLPSPYLTVVFSLSGPLPIDIPTGARHRSGRFAIPVGGLHTRPVLLPQSAGSPEQQQRGIQLAVHPFAARALFGVPAGALTGQVLELDDLLAGPGVLADRIAEPLEAHRAVDLVNSWLTDRLSQGADSPVPTELHRAWQLIVGSGGRRRIGDVASEVGWSRRHLTDRLRAETGLGAKDLARVTRFQRSRSAMLTAQTGSATGGLASVAATCGYTDQSHLTAEWREFAGCTPGQWIADELPSLTRSQH